MNQVKLYLERDGSRLHVSKQGSKTETPVNTTSYRLLLIDDAWPVPTSPNQVNLHSRYFDDIVTITVLPPLYNHQYLGNLPKEKSPGWHQEAQGITHDETHWYFSQNAIRYVTSGLITQSFVDPQWWRIPVSHDLSKDVTCGEDGVSCISFSETPLIHFVNGVPQGYDHVGDISWRDGFVFAAITGPDPDGTTPPVIAVFRGDASLEYVDRVVLTAQRVSYWVGIDPDEGFVYSSDRPQDTNHDVPFTKYGYPRNAGHFILSIT